MTIASSVDTRNCSSDAMNYALASGTLDEMKPRLRLPGTTCRLPPTVNLHHHHPQPPLLYSKVQYASVDGKAVQGVKGMVR